MRDAQVQKLQKQIVDLERRLTEQIARVAKYPAPAAWSLVVMFEIDSLDSETECTATILSYPCGRNSVPGENEYRQITVVDNLGCLLTDETTETLDGLTGYAVYNHDWDEDTCKWEIISLCCVGTNL